MNKIKAFFAVVGAFMIAYLVIALVLFAYTFLVVIFSGVDPNGGFDMFLGIFKLPWYVIASCVLIVFYSISYFYFLSKNKRRIIRFRNFIDSFSE